jgi:hypothetical protein
MMTDWKDLSLKMHICGECRRKRRRRRRRKRSPRWQRRRMKMRG